jgi:threonine/homoserine/homoserine lactone efflux protein
MSRSDVAARSVAVAAAASDLRRTYRQALVTNALNPKVAIFFLALLPQFIDAGAPHKTVAFLFLGAWFVVQGFVFLAVFALAVAPLRGWRPSDLWRRSLLAGGGLLFAALAARLAFAERA